MYSKNGNAVSRVLVADDDPVIRRWLASILEDEGYAVVSMDDGRAAFRTLQSDADFSAAVFDMSMPYLQGLDLIRYMRTEKRLMRIPVMMITAETDISTLATCFSAGATVLLPKPFTRNRLQQTLRLMLGENSSVNRLVGKTSLPTFTRNIPEIAPQQTSSVSAIVDRY